MKKYALISVFMVLILLLSACSKSTSSDPDAPPKWSDSPGVHVVMTPYTGGKLEKDNCKYASELLKDEGFNVTFEVFDSTKLQSGESYDDYIRANLNDNTVYLVPEEYADIFADEGLLGEYAISDQEETHFIRQSSVTAPPNRYAVLIRSDIYEEYDPEINTGSDLVDFLNVLKSDAPSQVPCATIPYLYDRMYYDSGYMALQLFMPEYGWYSLDDVLSGTNSLDVWCSMDGTQLVDIYHSKDAKKAVTAYAELMTNGLLDYYTNKSTIDLSQYPTLIVNIEDYYATLMLANNPNYASLNQSDYYINILYKDMIPEVEANTVIDREYVSIAGKDADVSEYIRFVEWLKTEENYDLFMNGKGDNEEYKMWEQLVYFENSSYTNEPKVQNIPMNLYEEIAEISYPSKSFVTFDVSERINKTIKDDADLLDTVTGNDKKFTSKMEQLTPVKASKFDLLIEQLFDESQYESMDDVIALLKE